MAKPPNGRVLRVKHGYNPNSSSIGSLIYVFPAKLLGLTAGFGVIAGLIYAAFLRPAGPDKEDETSEDAPQ